MVECDDADLVCLYLDSLDDERDGTARTAAGIGDALEVGDTAAARVEVLSTLESLQSTGLVVSEQRPVAGSSGSRRVYALTDEGRAHARTVRERVEDESVVVTNGTSEEVPLAEIDRYIERRPLVTALARLTGEGEVPLETHAREGFVGRQTELATVQEAIEQSFVGGTRTVVVTGAPGMGKSALVEEACAAVAADTESGRDGGDGDVVVARGTTPEDVVAPYAPFRQAFASLPDGETLTERIDAVGEEFDPGSAAEIDAQRTALFEELADALRSVAGDHRIVVVLENLQWADETALSLLAHLATTVDELVTPVAFVCTYREPAVVAADDHPLSETLATIDTEGELTEVRLGPLSRTDTRSLLADEIGRQRLPEAFVDRVYDHTGGTPLFVVETVRHLRESGRLDPGAESFPTDPDAVALPEAATERIDRRLQALDAPGLELLRLGAVLGERIPGRVLAAASDLSPARHREYVDVLVASGLWRPAEGEEAAAGSVDPASTDAARGEPTITDGGSGDLAFVSGALREAVVDRLSPAQAREYHWRAADAYLAVLDDPPAGRVAHHADRAGEYEQAIEYYRRAAEDAVDTYAHEDAVQAYERAIDLAREHGTERQLAALLGDLATVRESTSEYEAASEAVDEALELVAEDSREACRLLGIRAEVQAERADYDRARETTERQRDLASTLEAPAFAADSLRRTGEIAANQGEYDRAREYGERALAAYRALADRQGEAATLDLLGSATYELDEYDDAREYHEQSLELSRAIGDRRGEATSLKNLGTVAFLRGEYDRAREYYEPTLSVFRDVDDRHGEANALNNLGNVAFLDGDYDAAHEYYEESLAIDREIGDRHGQATTLFNLGIISSRQGRNDRAREYYEESLDISAAIGDRDGVSDALNSLGVIAEERGNYDRAREYYEESLETKREIGDRKGEAAALTNLGVVAQRRGEYDRAREYYEESLALARELASPRKEIAALRGLGRLARRREEYDDAEERFDAALDVDDGEHQFDVARVDLERARLATDRGDYASAREFLDRARTQFEDLAAAHFLGRCRLVAGTVAAATGSPDDAREEWTGALETFESVGAPQDALAATRELVAACLAAGDDDAAEEWCRRGQELLEAAPDPVVEAHREWIRRRAAEFGLS